MCKGNSKEKDDLFDTGTTTYPYVMKKKKGKRRNFLYSLYLVEYSELKMDKRSKYKTLDSTTSKRKQKKIFMTLGKIFRYNIKKITKKEKLDFIQIKQEIK